MLRSLAKSETLGWCSGDVNIFSWSLPGSPLTLELTESYLDELCSIQAVVFFFFQLLADDWVM